MKPDTRNDVVNWLESVIDEEYRRGKIEIK